MKVLVVEDEVGAREALVDLVKELGYEPTSAGSVVRDCAVLVLTGKGSVRTAVEAMKAGAHDYLLKPLEAVQLATALAHLAEQVEAAQGGLPPALPDPVAAGGLGGMVGRSGPMLEVFRLITRVARSNAPVMITGESGTEKKVAAATVHLLSQRSSRPFVALNCGAISPMLVESELFGHERGRSRGPTGAARERSRWLTGELSSSTRCRRCPRRCR